MTRIWYIALWGCKGLLLIIALGTVALWAVNRSGAHWINLSRFTVYPEGSGEVQMEIGGGEGRVFVDWHRYRRSGNRGRHHAEAAGSGWHWETDSNTFAWDDRDFFSSY